MRFRGGSSCSLRIICRALQQSLASAPSPHESLPSPASAHFPHTSAQLSVIARLYKPAGSGDNDADPDGSRVSANLVAKVATFLDHEHEDEPKALLRTTFAGIDDNMVRSLAMFFFWFVDLYPSFPA